VPAVGAASMSTVAACVTTDAPAKAIVWARISTIACAVMAPVAQVTMRWPLRRTSGCAVPVVRPVSAAPVKAMAVRTPEVSTPCVIATPRERFAMRQRFGVLVSPRS